MKHVKYTLFLLIFIITQCKWSGNRGSATLPIPSSTEDVKGFFGGIPDSLVNELPILPDDYFMTERNIVMKEGYEMDSKEALSILQQYNSIITPIGDDTFSFKRDIGKIRLFLAGIWPTSEDVDYFILKCFTEDGSVEVFIVSVADNSILDTEWIASFNSDSDGGIGIHSNKDASHFIPGQIMSRRQDDTVIVYSIDMHGKLTEEYRYFIEGKYEVL